MTQTGRIETGIVAAVLGLIALAGLVSLVSPPDTRDINRAPAPFPGVQANLLADSYREAWRDYLGDKLVLRRALRALNAAIEDDLFGDPPSSRVIEGEDGWLFLDDAFSNLIPLAGTRDPQPVAEAVRDVHAILAEAGFEARLGFAPHKPSIETDRVPDAVRHRADLAARQRDAVRAALAGAPGFIDLQPVLEAARRKAARPIYLRRDSHWNDFGAVAAARALVESLEPGLWNDAAVSATPVDLPYAPDLPRLQGRPEEALRPVIVVERPGVTVSGPADPGGPVQVWRSESAGPPLGPVLVVIADSYGVAVVPKLAPWFSEVRYVRLSAFDAQAHASVFDGAGAVCVQIVEREMFGNPPHGPRGLAGRLQAALAPAQ